MPVYPSGGTIAQSAGSPGFGPAPAPVFNASASVRFNPADTAYFSYIPTLQGNRSTWTWSGWVKRSVLGNTYQELFGTPNGASDATFLSLTFGSNGIADTLGFQIWNSTYRTTTQVFRDPAQWYHILLALDTTQSTAADRVKLYVNGTQITAFSTSNNPAQFAQLSVNVAGSVHAIGRDLQQSVNFGGYLADINFVDGLALTPSSFTATDANTGQLIPAQYAGNRGINGFYLPFSGAALAVDLGQNPKTTGQDYPYWKNNTLLVDTTNTNGQQNNSFSDSAQFGIGITRNGNTTQGTVSPFYLGSGTEQANGYYSGVFDGTGDYLNIPKSSTLNGPGDFTFEAWIYPNATASGTLCGFGANTATGYCGLNWRITTTTMQAYWSTNGTTETLVSGGAIQQNVWQHVAATRSGSTIRLFLNGRQVGTGTVSGALYTGSVADGALNSYTIGSYFSGGVAGVFFKGFISNFRYVNGTALYTANFTVPTTPLTATVNTSLLTCNSSVFSDSSTNDFAITPVGQAQPVQNNPFGMTAWSGYFDGTGDYLNCSPTALGTSNFTIECYVYFSGTSVASEGVFHVATSSVLPSAVQGVAVASGASGGWALYYNNGSQSTNTSLTAALNNWIHIAVVRNSGTIYLYINGVLNQSQADTANYTNTNAAIGGFYSTGFLMQGNISNFRIVNSALYSGTSTSTSAPNFTPPTAPLTAISGTQLLTCQSSTFIDNSPNAFAITVNGDSYTGTLNNPFNSPVNYTTPPPNGYGLYFNGVNENTYVSVPISITFGLTSNHVIEFDYFCDNLADNSSTSSISSQVPFTFGSFTTYLNLGIDVNGQIGGNYRADTINNVFASANGVIGAQQWYRIRWQKIGTAMSLFVNNVQVTPTVTITAGALTFTSVALGRFFYNAGSLFNSWSVGKMANLTITQNGVPLLDTFRSPYLRDFSSNNYVITLNGVCSTVPLSPTMPTSAYNAVSMGGSAYFDGTGDYLTLANSGALQLGSNSFTVEGWFYFASSSVVDLLYVLNSSASYAALRLQRDTASTISVYISNNGSSWANQITNIGSFAPSTWNHIAVTREGTTGLIRIYQNGVLIGSGTNASALHAGTVNYINAIQSGGSPVAGFVKYISGFRVLIGRNLYPSSFTPPVAPPTNILLTNFLANFTAAGIYDSVGNNPIETVGNVQVSTAVKKFGESSMFFDGSGDYLVIPTTNAPCQFGTADFTIEAWIYSTSIANQQMILSNRIAATGTANFGLQIYQSKVRMGNQNVDYLVGAITLSSNTWYHVAVSRISGTFRLFINGVLDVANTSAQTMSSNSITVCGGDGTYAPTQYPFIGYIQDLRVSKGVGRYSGAFTPPAAAFAYNQYDIGNQQWTPTNISVTAGVNQDNLVDSPSDYGTDTGLGGQVRGNYATMSPIDTVGGTFANGNLDVGVTAAAGRYIRATIAPPSGKWYWEATVLSTTGVPSVGVVATTALPSGGVPVIGVTYSSNAIVTKDSTNLGTQTAWSVNDVIGIAYDADNLTIALYRNNAIQTTVNLTTGYIYAPLFMSYANVTATSAVAFNFGQRAFSYTAPAGFKCLVSTNLPTVNGIGATSSTQATDYFNPLLYTGNGVSGTTLTGVGFQPDLVWIKARNQAYSNQVTDVVRGPSKALLTNDSSAELPNRTVGYVSAFASDGFTVTAGVTSIDEVNQNGTTYVAWNWKANGAGVANTAGTIPSTVSANTTSGCSIVTYTGTGASATVGHGLGATPAMIVVKNRDSSAIGGAVYHTSMGATKYLKLFQTTTGYDTEATDNTAWNGSSPTFNSNVFSVGSLNRTNSSQQMVAYCFAPVNGYSAFGSYTGNGSTDGPFVYTGFRPAFVLLKRSVGDIADWVMHDDTRSPYNVASNRLYTNKSEAEVNDSTMQIDILSNGFKLRSSGGNVNQSTNTYIYAAFAEFPFKYSRAR
jgi:hypothetical protein